MTGRSNSNSFVFIFLTCYLFAQNIGAKKPPLNSNFKEVDTCECGVHNGISGRIVGGHETQVNEFPWVAAIFSGKKLHCGGTLINDRYILTAGHCLKWSTKEDLTVVLGLHDKAPIEYGLQHEGLVVEIDGLIVHEDFRADFTYDTDDVGLIKLKEPVEFNSRISPVCLPKNDDEFNHKISTVIGWGKMKENGITSRYLRKADVKVLGRKECLRNSMIGSQILPSMLCAYNYKVDACQGDSGGPLIQEMDSEKMLLIGVVSWGIGCAKPGVPGVYSRVTHYVPWIASQTSDATYCANPNGISSKSANF